MRRVGEALGATNSVVAQRVLGVEDLVCVVPGPQEAGGVVMSLLQAGDFAIGLGAVLGLASHADSTTYLDEEDEDAQVYQQHRIQECMDAAGRALQPRQRACVVTVRIEQPASDGMLAPGKAALVAEDIAAAFTLLAQVLSRRTKEGREATALLRAGHLQSEAAAMVGITKQAMSQRLAAAGWQAEQAGWNLAVHMLARIDEL